MPMTFQTHRVLPHPPERVFEAFARPELLARWWGPSGFTNTFEIFEFRPGGRWKFVMHGPDGSHHPNESVFRDVRAPSTVVIHHVSAPRFVLTVTLAGHEAGTAVTWAQELEDAAVAARVRHIVEPANEQNLDRLTAVLAETATATILWRRLDLPGHEIARLERFDGGWRLSGTAVFAHERQPCKLEYAIACDSGWRTESAHVAGTIGNRAFDRRLSVDRDQTWYVDGTETPAVAGCIDIDLGFSPSTNLLPIRRLSLAVGESRDVTAAWLPFPGLVPERLPQRYRRETDTTYRYESAGGAFVRVLRVNERGFVIEYPGLWHAEST